LRTCGVPLLTAGLLRQKGYRTELLVMAAKPSVSYVSTIERYEQMLAANPLIARPVPKAHHDQVAEALAANLQELFDAQAFDAVRVFNRSMVQLYPTGGDSLEGPAAALASVMDGIWSQEEADMLRHSIRNAYAYMEARGAKGSDDWQGLQHLEASVEASIAADLQRP